MWDFLYSRMIYGLLWRPESAGSIQEVSNHLKSNVHCLSFPMEWFPTSKYCNSCPNWAKELRTWTFYGSSVNNPQEGISIMFRRLTKTSVRKFSAPPWSELTLSSFNNKSIRLLFWLLLLLFIQGIDSLATSLYPEKHKNLR